MIERFLKENRIKDKCRKALYKIFTPSDGRWFIKKINKNPKLSAQKLADEVGKSCSAFTSRRTLRSHDIHGRVPLQKPFINKKYKNKGLSFAKTHISKNVDVWK